MSVTNQVVYKIDMITWKQNGFIASATWKAYKYVDGIQGEVGGFVQFEDNSSETFIPFEQVTEEMVIGWVRARINDEDVEESLDKDILAKSSNQLTTGLPWSRFGLG